jgi:diguanylate cyclase (GGDEF)-like protein
MSEARKARGLFVVPGAEKSPDSSNLSNEEVLSMLETERAKNRDLEARLENSAARALIAEATAKKLEIDNSILSEEIKQLDADLKRVMLLTDHLFESKDKDNTFHILNKDGFLNKVENIRDLLDRKGGKEVHQGAVMLIDIDKFRDFNTKYGHDGGDSAIKALIEELKRITRHTDIIGRYGGGEEFSVFFPGATAEDISEKLKQTGDEYPKIQVTFSPKGEMGNYLPPVTVTVSGGIVDISRGEDLQGAIKAADRFLYAAKETGRNRLYSMGSEMSTESKISL